MSTRSQGKGQQSRKRILDETLRLAAERGYRGTTIALVAERSGLPPSSIYWHFANKDELLDAALSHGMAEWRQSIPDVEDFVSHDRRAALRERFRVGAEFLAKSSPYVRYGTLLLLERGLRSSAARRRYVETYRDVDSLLGEWWRRVLPPALQSDGWPEHFAAVHVAVMEGMQTGVMAEGWDALRLSRLVADGLDAHAEELSRRSS